MFTGLVQATGLVRQVRPMAGGSLVRLVVQPESWDYRPEVGDSVCVSGVCLTLAAPGPQAAPPDWWPFDVVPETLSRTTLGGLGLASRVNLERSVTASTLMGGHFVQGHVDGVAEVVAVRSGPDWRLLLRPPAALYPYLTPKGSVCLDGVSLTIADLLPDGPPHAGLDKDGQATGSPNAPGDPGGVFSVALIPTTLAKTTLGALQPGDRVNIECDVLTKAVVHTLRASLPALLAGLSRPEQAPSVT